MCPGQQPLDLLSDPDTAPYAEEVLKTVYYMQENKKRFNVGGS